MGSAISWLKQSFPPHSIFSVDDIPDLTGKVIIVTGGNTGVGYETVKALLAHNAKVYLAARNPEKAESSIKRLKSETGKDAIFLRLDLADLKSVEAAAVEFQSKEKELHVLFNNGGVMAPPIDMVTVDGYDLQIGTNVLGHFYFTKLLLPTLVATGSTVAPARIVNTSSSGILLWRYNDLKFDTFKDGPARKKYRSEEMYMQSKIGNVLFSNELSRRYQNQNIMSCSLNPGNLRTELWRHQTVIGTIFQLIFTHPAPMGALTQLWAGTSAEGATFGGKYLIPWAREGDSTPLCKDEKVAKDLWDWMEEQTTNI